MTSYLCVTAKKMIEKSGCYWSSVHLYRQEGHHAEPHMMPHITCDGALCRLTILMSVTFWRILVKYLFNASILFLCELCCFCWWSHWRGLESEQTFIRIKMSAALYTDSVIICIVHKTTQDHSLQQNQNVHGTFDMGCWTFCAEGTQIFFKGLTFADESRTKSPKAKFHRI